MSKDWKNNLFAGLNSLAATAGAVTGASAESTPQDIPKEELMTLCMKMNKRMQAMETKGKELVKKKTSLLSERRKMLDLFRMVIPVPTITNDDADLDLEALEQSWAEFESRRRDQLAELEGRVAEKDQLMQQSLKSMEDHYKKVVADLQAQTTAGVTADDAPETEEASAGPAPKAHSSAASIDSIIEAEKEKMAAQSAAEELRRRVAKSDGEVERLKGVETYLKQQLAAMEGAITAKNAEIESFQKELEANKTSYEEKVVFLQMQSTAAKAKEDERSRDTAAHRATVDKLTAQISALQRLVEEKDLSNKSNKDMIQALQTRLIELEPELALGRDKIAQLERNNSAQALLKAEQAALTTSLRTDLKNALDEVEAGKRRCRELEEFKVKAEGQLLRLAALTEQNQSLQSAIEDKDSLITRMRAEQQANERNHAMRTAMLATCEAQLEALQAEVGEKDTTCKEAIERVTSLQTALAATEARLAERVKEAAAEIASLENRISTIERDRDVAIQSLERNHEEAVEALKRDHAKKAAMARTLLSEKEEEVRTLSARVAELHEEISSGAPQERKIFELATTQARRETLHGLHNDTREIAFSQLQGKLAARDFELARAQQALVALQSEVGELRRTHQREGINMDYLKNIVIQYMTFPAQSSEKMSLVPVLAMLLQFTPKELSSVQRAVLLEPTQGGLWSSLGLGGTGAAAPAAPIAMPVFSSSRPAKEVKRPAVPIGGNRSGAATTTGGGAGPGAVIPAAAVGAGGSSGTGKGIAVSSGASTAAAMLAQQSTVGGNSAKGVAGASASMVGGAALGASQLEADSSSEYQPPTPMTPFTHALAGRGGPLSPASPSSNSDADHDTVGTYSPPKVSPFVRPLDVTDSPSLRGIAPQSHPQVQGSLMVELHTDTGASEDATYATPQKASPNPDRSNNNSLPVGLPHPSQTQSSSGLASTSGSGSFRAGAQRPRGSTNRMPINRASSMNASDYEFQQKLKTIGSDILSLDNSVSYDDAELDMTGDATYVDYEEGIEEGDELDDGQDGTSV